MSQTPATRTGSNVRAEMARAGISQTALAEKLGVSQAAVSKRLRGEVAFNVDELAKVADALKVPVAVLLADQPATT
jgi:transcriptional regulator with XRE-family HTH domain